MKLAKVNCKGYVLHRLGIDSIERYRSIPRVENLAEWFNIVDLVDSAVALAIIQGLKKVPPAIKAQQVVVHMIYKEDATTYSARDDINGRVRSGPLESLIGEYYLNEQNTHYLLFLENK